MAKSWGSKSKARPQGAQGRWLRRGIWTTALFTLCALLAWLLLQPFWHPQTQLVLLTGDVVTVDDSPASVPADYVVEDFRELLSLASVLDRSLLSSNGPLVLGSLREPDERSRLADQLNEQSGGSRDVLLVYVSAHGITQDDDAWLLAPGADPHSSSQGRYRLSHLLSQVRECRAPVKLLIIDAGRVAYDPLRGLLENDFPERLAEQVEALDDPNLWVLCSHRAGQLSHLSPALRRSIFGYYVSEGLKGAADANGDKTISLGELSQFVTSGVAGWVRQTTGGTCEQTPLLVRGAGQLPLQINPALSAVPKPTTGEPYRFDPSATIAKSQVAEEVKEDVTEDIRRELDQTIAESLARVTPRNQYGFQAANAVRQRLNQATGGKVALPGVPGATPAPPDAAAPPADDALAKGVAPAGQPAQPAQAATGKEGAAATGENPETAPLPPVAELLAQAWQIRDELMDPERPVTRPVDYAPHLWRRLEARLLALDRKHRTGFVRDPTDLQRPLAELVATLEQIAANQTANQLPEGSPVREIAALRPGLRLPVGSARSLALVELAAREGGPGVPAELATRIAELDRIIAGGNRSDLDKLVASFNADEPKFIELRLAGRVSRRPDTDWQGAQLLLANIRAAEQAAAGLLSAPAWVRERVASADEVRIAAERSWEAPISPDRGRLVAQLTKSRDEYLAVIDDLAAVRRAERQLHDVLHRLPHYLAWHAAAPESKQSLAPTAATLAELIGQAEQLSLALASPGPASLVKVRTLVPKLAASRQAAERGIGPLAVEQLIDSPPAPGATWQIVQILQTPLPSAATRAVLEASIVAVDSELASKMAPPAADTAANGTNQAYAERRFMPRADLEYRLAKAAVAPTNEADWSRLAAAWSYAEASAQSESLDQVNRELGIAIQDLYRNLPSRLQRGMLDEANGRAAASRTSLLQQLAAWQQAERLVLPGATAQSAGASVQSRMADARAFDLLVWQSERAKLATEDAPPVEAAYSRGVALDYQAAAEKIPDQPAMAGGIAAPLALVGSSRLSLTYDSQGVLDFQLHYSGASGTKAWIVAEYDDSLLALLPATPAVIYSQRELAAKSSEPLATQVLRLQPSATLVSGRPLPIRLPISRLSPAVRTTQLVLRVFTDQHVARYDVPIELPLPEGIRLVVRGTAGSWGANREGMQLFPFPNRTTHYALQLASGTGAERTVDVQLFALRANADKEASRPLPGVTFTAADAARLRQTLRLGLPLAEAKGIKLAGDGTPAALLLVKPAAAPPAAPAAGASPPAAAAPPPAEPPPAEAPPTPLDHGAVLVVTDTADQSQVFKQLTLATQRPQRYVSPRVRYSRQRERIEIAVAPLDPALLPPDGVRLSAELVEPIPPDSERQLAALLKPGQEAAEMFVEVPASPGRVVTLHVSVDGFPRAFLYRVPCSSDTADVPEDTDALAVHIGQLPKGTVYKPPQSAIPVELQIDAPSAAASDALRVEVGVDRNRDRELDGDEIVLVTSDRQARVTWGGLNDAGELLLATAVGDHVLDIPALGVGSSRANVIARIGSGEREAWSVPVEIVFDDQPPRLSSLELAPARRVVIGGDVEVSALADDRELAGISRVEAMFDVARSGQFGPDDKPASGGSRDDGRWVVKLPTAGMSSGSFNILLRAIDRAGNVGNIARTSVQLVSPEEATAAATSANLADIEGDVVFGDAPQAKIDVYLTAADAPPPQGKAATEAPQAIAKTATDAQGRFRFAKVPPGNYRVVAKGLVRNKNRTGEQAIKFQTPKEVQPLRVELP